VSGTDGGDQLQLNQVGLCSAPLLGVRLLVVTEAEFPLASQPCHAIGCSLLCGLADLQNFLRSLQGWFS
jgi:hypothetical protein